MRYKVQYRLIGSVGWSNWQTTSYPEAPYQPDTYRRYTFPDYLQAHQWAEFAQAQRVQEGRQRSTPIEWQVVVAEAMP